MSSGFVGKKVSHQRVKVAELAADPEALKAFVADGDGKYVLTQVVAGKDWGIGTIWKLVQDSDGPVLARVFDGSAPEGTRLIPEDATGKMATKTASLHVPAEDVTERVASGIATGASESDAVDQAVTPIVLDWVDKGWRPSSATHIAKMADTQLADGKLSPEEAGQIKRYASKIYPVVQNYIGVTPFGEGEVKEACATSPVSMTIKSLASYKPKGMSWGKFASLLKALIKAAEMPPQLKKKDEKPAEKKDEKKDAKPAEKKDEKPADKKEEGKNLPPWLKGK